MRTVNTVTLLGNIARSPEIKVTSNGKKFATFVIATHKDSTREGGKTTVPEFHNIVAWGSLSSIAENFCKKGRLIYLEGYLKTRSWSHENGVKIFRTEVVCNNIIALNSGIAEEGNESNHYNDNQNQEDESFFSSKEEDFFHSS